MTRFQGAGLAFGGVGDFCKRFEHRYGEQDWRFAFCWVGLGRMVKAVLSGIQGFDLASGRVGRFSLSCRLGYGLNIMLLCWCICPWDWEDCTDICFLVFFF